MVQLFPANHCQTGGSVTAMDLAHSRPHKSYARASVQAKPSSPRRGTKHLLLAPSLEQLIERRKWRSVFNCDAIILSPEGCLPNGIGAYRPPNVLTV